MRLLENSFYKWNSDAFWEKDIKIKSNIKDFDIAFIFLFTGKKQDVKVDWQQVHSTVFRLHLLLLICGGV